MDSKKLIWFTVAVGSTIGGYIPSLWGAGFISFSSIILTAVGGFIGLWVGYRLGE